MNQQDIIDMIQGKLKQQEEENVPVELLDEFIKRVRERDDDTLYTLGQRIAYRLNSSPVLSFEEVRIYPQVLRRIEELLKKGEV